MDSLGPIRSNAYIVSGWKNPRDLTLQSAEDHHVLRQIHPHGTIAGSVGYLENLLGRCETEELRVST